MQRITINVDDEFKEMIERRASFQRRSVSKEIVFLLETALAQEESSNIAILRMHMQAEAEAEHC
jgi:plasmid stability protein